MTGISRRSLLVAALAAPAIVRSARAENGLVVRIGAPLPLTGALASEGLKQQHGYELWADTVNKQGGIAVGNSLAKVELVYADYESNTARAVQATERMISQNKVAAILGAYGSGAVKASSSVTERYRVPMLAPNASAREVYDQGYKFLFGTEAPNDALTVPLAQFMRARMPDLTRMVILSRNDLFPLALAQQMEKAAQATGIQVASFQNYAVGSMDHASALTEMAAAKPQWVFVTGYTNDLILVRRQMTELKFSAPIVTMLTGPSYKEFSDALGPLAEGITAVSWWEPSVPYHGIAPFPTAPEYAAAFTARYGTAPDYGEASSTACCLALQAAAEKAGSLDPVALRDALAAIDVMSFYGRLKFGPTGQIVAQALPLFQLQGGKRVILAPADIRQGDLNIL
ncbi:MAG: extracellular ligand-binding receptor [Gammaproteobacteria bacterium]|nr:extracellular ligand-binding receptor [Gammaproteobacteria bacterium]